jgi:hypothetical protein
VIADDRHHLGGESVAVSGIRWRYVAQSRRRFARERRGFVVPVELHEHPCLLDSKHRDLVLITSMLDDRVRGLEQLERMFGIVPL